MAANKPEVNYKITASLPTEAEYTGLRTVSGLTPPPATAAISQALSRSVHCLVARLISADADDAKAIGMVRLVGDGALVCQLCDMAVDPVFQGRGIGKALLDGMLSWIDEHAAQAYISLIGDAPGQALYRSRGFVETAGLGMERSVWGR